jgi:hypothetical protein
MENQRQQTPHVTDVISAIGRLSGGVPPARDRHMCGWADESAISRLMVKRGCAGELSPIGLLSSISLASVQLDMTDHSEPELAT